jgi:hypothetical protein
MGTTAGGVESAIGGLLHGIVNGYGLRQQLLNYKQQNEAYTRKAALDESNASIQDIMNRQAFQQNTRPVVNGMVQDTLPAQTYNQPSPQVATAQNRVAALPTPQSPAVGPADPYQDPGGPTAPQPSAPVSGLPGTQATVPATTYMRKADASRQVFYRDRQGNKIPGEVYTPEEQAQRDNDRAAAAAKSKFMATAISVDEPDGTRSYIDPAHWAAYKNATGQNAPIATPTDAQASGLLPPTVPGRLYGSALRAASAAAANKAAGDRSAAKNTSGETIAAGRNQTLSDIAGLKFGTQEDITGQNNATKEKIAQGNQAGANARAALRGSGAPTPGQQGVQSRFEISRLNALAKEEQDYHDVRNRLGPQLASGTDDAGKPIARPMVQAQYAKATNNLQDVQYRKGRVLKAAQPPRDVVDKLQEGQQATAPDGHTWIKKDGIVYFMN